MKGNLLPFLLTLLGVLGVMFFRSLDTKQVLFSNDAPLGALTAAANNLVDGLFGGWGDQNWVGVESLSLSPSLTIGVFWLGHPVGFSKFYVPICLTLLGTSVWVLFRELRFSPVVCALGGLAAALNMNTFSHSCWGLASRAIVLAMAFFALAALQSMGRGRAWLKAVVAGLAVGMGVIEGYDMGAIFSLYVAAFAVFVTLNGAGGAGPAVVGKAVARVLVVAVCAGVLAVHTVSSLVGTQIKGVAGTQQDEKSKAERWDFATQWSLPKKELLRVLIPGLFGYRMDTPHGGNYWGAVGQDPSVPALLRATQDANETVRNQANDALQSRFMRHSGAGEYAGVLVVLLALWAVGQSLRGAHSPFTIIERRMIWFWTGLAGISVLFAFGRHAPFYQLVYALPYFSTIRNPIKFMHLFQMALLILFGYGLQVFWLRYVTTVRESALSAEVQVKNWWTVCRGFERRWVWGMVAALGGSAVAWLIYAAGRQDVEAYLKKTGFGPEQAPGIVSFSLHEVGWFLFFFALTAALVALTMSGYFGGRRAKLGAVLFGLLLVVDLGRANAPWIIYYDYQEKYASNPVIDFLRAKPYEGRVVTPRFRLPDQFQTLPALANEWLQHHYQYYNIQSLDVIQMPRVPEDMRAYQTALGGSMLRLWQLTNTRYLLTAAGAVDSLNQQLDPVQRRFRVHASFELGAKPGVTKVTRIEDLSVVVKPNAPYGLIEFTGALPRVKLYANWLSVTNDESALRQLADPAFDPARQVLVAADLPAPKPEFATNTNAGTVEFKSYQPKRIQFTAKAEVPAVFLLNDKHHPAWKVFVDGKAAPLLRCNYLMRGVQLEPGAHEIEFRYEPPIRTLYVSFAALAAGLGLLGFLALVPPRTAPAADGPAPVSSPPASVPTAPTVPTASPSAPAGPKPASSKRKRA
ncbi:hypothetical protein LBMAG56_01870 [Verrucomicrobiota bacterium]|nr:hypothetical protein LBMAG56_01870 [Verrucomicrobiota bacterium]